MIIKVKKDEFCFSIEMTEKESNNDNTIRFVNNILGIFKDIMDTNNLSSVNNNVIDFKPTLDKNKQNDKNDITIRKRIPNKEDLDKEKNRIKDDAVKGDYVDMSKLKVQGFKSYAEKNFMCPNCKQKMSIKVNGKIVIKDIEDKNKTLYLLNNTDKVLKAKDNKAFLNFNKKDWKESIDTENVFLVSSDGIEGECICCGEKYPTSKWVEVYNALKNDAICPICGSLMCYNINKEKGNYYKCENKKCNYEVKQLKGDE